jgi:hypothetical protein
MVEKALEDINCLFEFALIQTGLTQNLISPNVLGIPFQDVSANGNSIIISVCVDQVAGFIAILL